MSVDVAAIKARYAAVSEQLAEACVRAGRAADAVTLVAVSKGHPVAAIEAAMEAGCLDFGENRVQEWRDKAPLLPRRVRWHLIGHLQRNKVKYFADEVTLIHTIDSDSVIDELEKRADAVHEVLVQVNVGGEAQKTGAAFDEATALVERCAASDVVRPVGLMCIPPYTPDPEQSRPHYRALAQLAQGLRESLEARDPLLAEGFNHLSMGMSDDYPVAVEEGSTLVRVGTAIFGPRNPHPGGVNA